MVVYVCGTGCQFFVKNDHKLGCAASVEHTPHPLGRPSSYNVACARVNRVMLINLCAETI